MAQPDAGRRAFLWMWAGMVAGLWLSALFLLIVYGGMLANRQQSALLTFLLIAGGLAIKVGCKKLSKHKRRSQTRVAAEESASVDHRRAELAKIRADIKALRADERALEEELLEEENRNASGPERLKHGIPTDD
ncbi:hypothetical protein EDM68_03445 [Candidatus Uhrbacteria bacterium]|nr:MAG: hypothetical protein EDM68_03445 [Candidatus Uhrbacteria bacterium]